MPQSQMTPLPGFQRVLVMGQGYVGLTLAMRAVEVGHAVVGFDIDDALVKALAAAEPPHGDVDGATMATALATDRYRATADPADCADFEVAVIAVPTPLRDGNPDMGHIEGAAVTLAPYVTASSTVVLESTTYPGTTEELLVPILESGSGLLVGADFHVGYSPERIDPGNTEHTLATSPKVVSGLDPASLAVVDGFYRTIVRKTVRVGSPAVAELTKLLENTFRHVNVALVNELAMFAHDLDIDVWEAVEAAGTKPFGFMRFDPGPGVGGHCLPVDPSYLSWRTRTRLGRSFRFVELANDVNDHMPGYVVRRLVLALNRDRKALNGARVLLLGLAYKRNTGDARESPALEVARLLVEAGADVRVADPYVDPRKLDLGLQFVEPGTSELACADAVVLLTDHDTFDLEAVATHAPYVLDTRNRLAGARVERL